MDSRTEPALPARPPISLHVVPALGPSRARPAPLVDLEPDVARAERALDAHEAEASTGS